MSFREFKSENKKELKPCLKCNTRKEVSEKELKEDTVKSMKELKEELGWLFKR